MLKKIVLALRGALVVTLLLFWLVFLATFVLLTVGMIALFPFKKWRVKGKLFLLKYPCWWMDGNNLIMRINTRHKWDIQGTGELSIDAWYLLIANHRSWIDILVIGSAFNRRIPPLKFFMKKELFWTLPLAGFGVYFLDYPLLARHSLEDIRKRPELKNQDIETTKKACEKFKTVPTSIINFVEGTRFTLEKQLRQASPYRHLLKPKSGGIAIVAFELQNYLKGIVNVTVNYFPRDLTLWQFCCGNFDKIVLRYELLPFTPELLGNYYEDRQFRANFQRWLNEVWKAKDQLLNTQEIDLNKDSA